MTSCIWQSSLVSKCIEGKESTVIYMPAANSKAPEMHTKSLPTPKNTMPEDDRTEPHLIAAPIKYPSLSRLDRSFKICKIRYALNSNTNYYTATVQVNSVFPWFHCLQKTQHRLKESLCI